MILNTKKTNNLKSLMFFDPNPIGIARYDQLKYKVFDRLTNQQLSYFWRPEEIDLSRDIKDFRSLSEHEQHIFTSNLKRQIVLDSVQGRAPCAAFGPICTLPELEAWLNVWQFSEMIHSKSYTHIIRNVYSDPSIIFDGIMDIEEIVDCAKDITKYYDDLIDYNNKWQMPMPDDPYYSGMYFHKKKLWLALNAVNALEGVRFYVSFACSWAFAERKYMQGNANIISLICKDENLHLGSTQTIIKLLPKDDPDFIKIEKNTKEEVRNIFKSVAEQEKKWAEYLFKDGSLVGLNCPLLVEYVEFITNSRMESIGLEPLFKKTVNPLPWTQNWISNKGVQPAPQELNLVSYQIGETKQDVSKETFKGFKL